MPSHPTVTMTTPDGDDVEIDVDMVPIIHALWDAGVVTLFCCQGPAWDAPWYWSIADYYGYGTRTVKCEAQTDAPWSAYVLCKFWSDEEKTRKVLADLGCVDVERDTHWERYSHYPEGEGLVLYFDPVGGRT